MQGTVHTHPCPEVLIHALFNGATIPYLQNCWGNILEHTESTFSGNVREKQLQLLKILLCHAKIKKNETWSLNWFFFLLIH